MQTQPRVLIVGAGLGGMLLAQLLRKNDIPFRMFERDISPTARVQGWNLSLHWIVDELLSAVPDDLPPLETVSHLHNVGLLSDVAIFNGDTTDEMLRVEQNGLKFIRANRKILRNWLATNLNIEWDKKFERYEEDESGVTVHFADGTSARGDILVGADGARSRVRTQLLGSEVSKVNVLPLEVCVGQPKFDQEWYKSHMNEFARSCYLVEGAEALLFVGLDSISEDRKSANYYWLTTRKYRDDEENKPLCNASKNELYHTAIRAVDSLNPKFLEVVHSSTPSDMLSPPILMEDWAPPEEGLPKGRVTLLGDAAHKMTPLRGEGGNIAMQDGLDLGRLLNSNKGDLIVTLKEYENIMIDRGRKGVFASRARTLDWKNHPLKVPSTK